jgi:hypothetical protein
MVAQQTLGRALSLHRGHGLKDGKDLGSAVDQVAHKDGHAGAMLPDAPAFLVTQQAQEGCKFSVATMDITDDVNSLGYHFRPQEPKRIPWASGNSDE